MATISITDTKTGESKSYQKPANLTDLEWLAVIKERAEALPRPATQPQEGSHGNDSTGKAR